MRSVELLGAVLWLLVSTFFAAGLVSWWITGRVREYALARSILDIPNGRSSHEAPTPRGGGLAIVLVVLAATVIGWLLGWLPLELAGALVGGGSAVAIVGWIDDHRGLTRLARAVVHLAVGICVVAVLGGLPSLVAGNSAVPLGAAGSVLGVLFVAWLINLYNFMDGIDGIAAGEAASSGVLGGALLLAASADGLAMLAFATAAASIGFLIWNWQPAKIFMGDVGSGFLGVVFAVLALASERVGAVPLMTWLILLGVFIFDATLTLIRRAARGERWYQEHRSHAYQRAVQSGWSHARVSGGVLVINAGLGALALATILRPELLVPMFLAAYALLALLYLAIERRRPLPSVSQRPRAGVAL